MSERVFVRYRKPGADQVVLELHGDPFDICNRVAAGIGLIVLTEDPQCDAVIRERVERARKDA